MRLLYVITRANNGGAQANVRSLAVAAKQAGHEVTVAVGETGWLADALRQKGVETIVLPYLRRSWNPFAALAYVNDLHRLLKKRPMDVVHFHSSNALLGILAVRSLKAPKPKTVATIHGLSALHPGWKKSELARATYRLFMRFVLHLADKIIYVCWSDLETAMTHDLSDPKKSIVIHNGVAETERLSREEARRKLIGQDAEMLRCLDAKCFIIGTVARLDYPKNLEMLIEAAEKLRTEKKYRFVVIGGDGDETDNIKKLIGDKHLEDIFLLAGEIPDAARLIPAFDVFALTSRFEGLPYAVLEAALAKVPIVATNVGGVGEIIEHRVSGRLVQSGDAAALAREIDILAADPTLADRQKRAAYAKVLQDFNEAKMDEEILALYR